VLNVRRFFACLVTSGLLLNAAVSAATLPNASVSAATLPPDVEAVRQKLLALAAKLSPTNRLLVEEYPLITSLLADASAGLDTITASPKDKTMIPDLRDAFDHLNDAYRFLQDFEEHGKMKDTSIQSSWGQFETYGISTSSDFWQSMKAKYGSDPISGSRFTSVTPTVYPATPMIALISVANFTLKQMPTKQSRGAYDTVAKHLRFPITVAMVRDALTYASQTNEADMFGLYSEWAVNSDRANWPNYGLTQTRVLTPFASIALDAATARAKYQTVASAESIMRNPKYKLLRTITVLFDPELGAFDDSVCILKQDSTLIRPIAKSISHPIVISTPVGYLYDMSCAFKFDQLNLRKPFSLVIANTTIVTASPDSGGIKKGDVNYTIDPLTLR
jgi:hypothetical protein